METKDGRNIKCWVNSTEYNLSKDGLFLVRTKGGKIEVEQLDRDLSSVQADEDSCKKFAQTDPAISKLIGAGGGN
jgi:hypothetical protein